MTVQTIVSASDNNYHLRRFIIWLYGEKCASWHLKSETNCSLSL